MVDSAVNQRFAKALVTLLQPHILSDQRNGDFVLGPFDLLHHCIPLAKIRLTGLEMQLTDDQFVQPFFSKDNRHFVDRLHIFRRDYGVLVHIAKHRNLALEFRGNIPIRSAQENIGLDTDFPKLIDRMLRRLGLQFTGCADVGHQRQMHIQHIVAPDVVRHLSDGFKKREAFNVSDRPADFDNGDVHSLGDPRDRLFDLIRHMRHDLHRPSKIVSPPLLRNDRMIDPACRVITFLRQ